MLTVTDPEYAIFKLISKFSVLVSKSESISC